MKIFDFKFTFDTDSLWWRSFHVLVWIAFLSVSLWFGWLFSAGFSACALIDSIFEVAASYFKKKADEIGDEE